MPIELSVQLRAWLVLGAYGAFLAWRFSRQRTMYAGFKAVADGDGRALRMRVGLVSAALTYGGSALAGLAVVGRLDAVTALPPEFGAMRAWFGPDPSLDIALIVAVTGALVSGVIGGVLRALRGQEARWAGPHPDIEALLPRSARERVWMGLLSLNAGVSEELFFRLMLPLLLAIATGMPTLSLGLAVVVFGLAHVYQGWIGVIGTAAIGLVLTLIYLMTGALWLVMLAHVVLDLNSLVLRPWINERVRALPLDGRVSAASLPSALQ